MSLTRLRSFTPFIVFFFFAVLAYCGASRISPGILQGSEVRAMEGAVGGLSAIAQTGASSGSASIGEGASVQLVAVQMAFDINNYWSRESFETKIRSMMERVRRSMDPGIPTLVVFPEDVGLMLVVQGMKDELSGVKSIAEAIETATRARAVTVGWTKLTTGLSWVPACYLNRNKDIAQAYFEVFSKMADEYNVYIVAGSVVLPHYEIRNGKALWNQGHKGNRVYNSSFLFGPDGSIIGRQDKVHLVEMEQEAALDLASGSPDDIKVFDTEIGKIGIAICLDSFQDDVIDSLVRQGAEILVQPSANPGPWSKEQQIDWMNSCYKRTFDEGKFYYGINPMMTGKLWDLAFFGQSGIIARVPAKYEGLGYKDLEPAPGFIALASGETGEEILVVKVTKPGRYRLSSLGCKGSQTIK